MCYRFGRESREPTSIQNNSGLTQGFTGRSAEAYLAEIRQRLDEAASIAKTAQACADAGNTKQGIAIALDVEQLVYEVNTLLNAASLINRITKG